MYRFFSRNSFLAFASLPLILILYRLRLLMSPEISYVASDADLYTPIWEMTFGAISEGSRLSIAIAIILTLITALVINSITNRYRFVEHPNNLGGLFFIILSNGFIISQSLHPISIFALLLSISIYRLFKCGLEEQPMHHCFDSAMLISISFLFWAKVIWFLPLYIIIIFTLRTINLRSFIAILLGFSVPLIIASTYYYYQGNLPEIISEYWQKMMVPVAFYKTNIFARSYIIIYAILLIVAILSNMRNMQMFKIIESRYYRVIIWLVFYSSLFIILPHFSFEMQIIIAMGGAIMISSYIMRLHRYRWQEIYTTLIAIIAWIIQWYF